MAFLLINFVIFLSSYGVVSRREIESLSGKIIGIGILSCAQIVFTQLVLGAVGFLYPSTLVFSNLLISAIIFVINFRHNPRDFFVTLKQDCERFVVGLRGVLSPANFFLAQLAVLMSLWFVIAAYWLPPRGVDDLGYHLPLIYEAIVTHRFSLSPVEYIPYVAYPANAELFTLWPTIFFHHTHFIGLVEYIFALWHVVAIYSIARILGLNPPTAFFIGMQFLFVPVVLAQSGSSYIDVITSAFFLFSLYSAAKFYLERKDFYLYLTGISLGLMAGMKYSMLLLAASAGIPVAWAIFLKRPEGQMSTGFSPWVSTGWRKAVLFFLLIFIFGGYWYFRNLLFLQNPLFPMDLTQKSLGLFNVQNDSTLNFGEICLGIFQKVSLLFCRDIGIGSFHGGFGIVFWGLAFPCWIYVFIESVKNILKGEIFPFFLWAQVFIGLAIIALVPLEALYLNARYSLFIISMGLLSLGKILQFFKERFLYQKFIEYSCCILAVLSVVQLASVRLPSYAVDAPIRDILRGKSLSQNRYLRLSSYMPEVSRMWEALDFLTKNDKEGLSCYYATDPYFFWTAPIYGTNLQNRIWNFQTDTSTPPEALIFYFGPLAEVFYSKDKKITLEDAIKNQHYDLAAFTKHSYLFIQRDFLKREGKTSLLAEFYAEYFSSDIENIQRSMPALESHIPVVTSSSWGVAVKYFYLRRRISNAVHLVPEDWEEKFVENNQFPEVYTVNRPLEGFRYEEVYRRRVGDQELRFYKNERR